MPTTILIKVRQARPIGGHRLEVEFSDDFAGECDMGFILDESGPMLEPLKDADYFKRVFVESGVPTWPNGYDWDPIALHDMMKEAGLLRQIGNAAE
jgi:hypothetical protein